MRARKRRASRIQRKSKYEGQAPAVHEFGHMLGNPDEYERGIYRDDAPSLMNKGSEVRQRHLESPRAWVREKLKAYGIE